MFGALREIGEAVLLSGELEFKIERIKGEGLLAKIIFDLDEGKLECDCGFKCDMERAKEYLWIGNAVGQKPQMVLTTDKPKYLLDPSNRKKWAIGRIADGHFGDEAVKKLQLILKEVEEKFFSNRKSLVLDLEAVIAKKGHRLGDIVLFTACVKKDGKIIDLVKESGYRKLLHFVSYATEIKEYPILNGRCHICGEEKEVLSNPSYPEGTPLCIYVVDKAGFMPGLSRKPEELLKAHAVCPECKQKLVLGLNFVERNLTATIGETSTGRLNVFLIPKILGGLSYEMLKNVALKMKGAFGVVSAYKGIEDVERLMNLIESEGASYVYLLNILFGYRVSSHFSYQYLIQDVPVMRFVELARMMVRASNEAAALFDEKAEKWSIGFQKIFFIFPLRRIRNTVEWKPLVELFESMLNGTSYPTENLIYRAVLFARITRYGAHGGYNIKPPEKAADEWLCKGIFKYNLLLNLLREVGAAEMGDATSSFKIPDEEIENVVSMMGYAEWQKALFLLGVIVGKIGIEQHKRGDEKKAVLNKINFEGMPAERVKLLANHVLDGLRNYRTLDSRSETIYAYMKMMLDRNLEALHNPIDNVFYILSGYAYATLKSITSGR